jgi:hypothetical protein
MLALTGLFVVADDSWKVGHAVILNQEELFRRDRRRRGSADGTSTHCSSLNKACRFVIEEAHPTRLIRKSLS